MVDGLKMFHLFLLVYLICKPILSEMNAYYSEDRVYKYLNKFNSQKKLSLLKSPLISKNNFFAKKEIYFLNNSSSINRIDFKNESKENDITEDFLASLYSIKDLDELMQALAQDNNIDKMRLDYLFDGKGEAIKETRRFIKPKLPKLFAPAGCTPEIKTIEIGSPNSKAEFYFPWCVKLPRCSGCCPSKRLTCIPATTSIVNITVAKLKYVGHGGKFKFSGVKTFVKQKHETCKCECLQKEQDCNLFQVYNREECRCVCHDIKAASVCMAQEGKYWDYIDCGCKCIVVNKCSSDLRFNHETCRCEAFYNYKKIFETNGNQTGLAFKPDDEHEIDQMDKYHRLNGYNGINPEKLPPSI